MPIACASSDLCDVAEYEAEAWETGSRHSDETGYDTKSRSRSRAPSPHSFQQASQAGDFYRDTNLTSKNGSNPNLAASNMSHYGGQATMSQYAIPQLPFMPFAGGPGSVHGSEYGGMAMPGPIPYQGTGSVYAMSMMPPVMPMAPRNTVMTSMNMFPGGDVNGSQGGFAPPQAPGMMSQRPMSTFSMATSVNPFAGPSNNAEPTDEELVTALRNYLSTQDLMTVTKK